MDTTPDSGVTESPEAKLEAIFARSEKQPEPETRDVEDVADEEVSDDQPESVQDEAEDGQSEAQDDGDEVEIEGERFKLPKKVAEIVAKRDSFQRDYTQKTQEVAEVRKRVQDREQYLAAREQILSVAFKEAAEVESLEAQLKQFDALDWNQIIQSDPQQAMQLNFARQQVERNLGSKREALKMATANAEAAQAEHKRRQLEMGRAELQRRLGGQLTDDVRQRLAKAAQELGYSDADLSSAAAMHALHLASKYLALQKSKPLVEKKVAQAKPMVAPAARSGNQTVEANRREELRAKMRKSGNSQDAEAFLARLFEGKRKR